MKQIALAISEGPAPSLDNFIAGPNQQVLAALQDFLAGKSASTLYLWGPPASGKTHLLSACAAAFAAQDLAVGWLQATDVDTGSQRFDPQWRLLVLDDAQAFSPEQQQQVFAWLIHAQSAGCSVLAAGTVPPADLPLRDDVRSRLAWGQVAALQALSEADCKMVLQHSAKARGIVLNDEVVDFVMHRFSRDLGSLMQLLDMLDRFALENKRAVTVPLVTAMLRSL